MTDRNSSTESAAEPSSPLGVLHSIVEDARRCEGYLEENDRGIYDDELADFLSELRDETSRRAKRAKELLAQRLADGGVHLRFSGKSMPNFGEPLLPRTRVKREDGCL